MNPLSRLLRMLSTPLRNSTREARSSEISLRRREPPTTRNKRLPTRLPEKSQSTTPRQENSRLD